MNKLHSIYLSHSINNKTENLPGKITRNLDSFKECHPGIEHQLYEMDSGREFIKTHFDADVLSAFDSLKPLAYKADLLRYCILYEFGGIYADLSLYFHSSANNFDKNAKIFIYRDVISRAPWIASNSLIVTDSKMHVFLYCIEAIISNVKNDYYGTNALCPTGPNLFGASLASTTPLFEIASGEAVRISRCLDHSYAYLNSSGKVVAVAIKNGQGLGSLGASSAENYNDFYNQREIYSHNTNKKTWTYQDLVLRSYTSKRNDEGKIPSGIAIWGPYTRLSAGIYIAQFILTEFDFTILKNHGNYTIDVCTNFGKDTISSTNQIAKKIQESLYALSISFNLIELVENLEVRLHIQEPIDFKIERLEIERAF